MCHPAAWFAAAQGAQFIQSWQAANAQQTAIDAQNELARTAGAARMLGVRQSQAQQRGAIAVDVQRVVEGALKARATARASAAAGGVSGDSVDAVISEFGRQESDRLATLARQSEFVDVAAENQARGAFFGTQSSLRYDAPMPSFFSYAAQGLFEYKLAELERADKSPGPGEGLTKKNPSQPYAIPPLRDPDY
jgi:hypothetical protein